MENITIRDTPDKIKEFLELPQGISKNYTFSKLPYKEYQKVVLGKDGKDIYFSSTHYKLSKNKNSYYSRVSNRRGFSFKDNKLSLWYGSKIEDIPDIEDFIKEMNWNFIDKKAYGYITKSSLEKLLKGKITSTRDLLAHYAKSVRLKCSTEFLYQAVIEKDLHKFDFFNYASHARDVDHFLQFVLKDVVYYDRPKRLADYHIVRDLVNQFSILDKKIDFRWSEKRMLQEHNDATFELMKLEAGNLSNEKITYTNFNLPSNFELLDNQQRVFLEGQMMRHCVYTNYWFSIKSGSYLAFHVKLNNENATLGVELTNKKMVFNQVYLYRNQPVSQEMRKLCMDFIELNKDVEITKQIETAEQKEVCNYIF
jgi:hypothetical protein